MLANACAATCLKSAALGGSSNYLEGVIRERLSWPEKKFAF